MSENVVFENIIDMLDNHFVDRPLVTESNADEYVSDLFTEIETLKADKEVLAERISDFEENL